MMDAGEILLERERRREDREERLVAALERIGDILSGIMKRLPVGSPTKRPRRRKA